jgi:uncharacterized protein (TIGR02271 family)
MRGAFSNDDDDRSIVRHEEELDIGVRQAERGAVGVRTSVDVEEVREVLPREREHFRDLERATPSETDSGEIEQLDDGSISIPIFEERLVVTKELVVRERVIVRKTTETIDEEIRADIRRERVDVENTGMAAEER